MVQKEVGDKMTAKPGSPGYGPLSLYCRYFADTYKTVCVKASSFHPPPAVDSVFMRLNILQKPPVYCDRRTLLKVIDCAFTSRRKTLVNNLQAAFALSRQAAMACVESAGVKTDARGEQLGLEAYAADCR